MSTKRPQAPRGNDRPAVPISPPRPSTDLMPANTPTNDRTPSSAPAPISPRPCIPDARQTLDVSFWLATVLAGETLVHTVHTWYDELWPHPPAIAAANGDHVTWAAVIVVVTTLRFFHGNVMWNYVAFGSDAPERLLSFWQRFWMRLSAYYIHMAQYGLFYFCGLSITDELRFIKGMGYVSLIDVIWTFVSWQAETRPILRAALGSWMALNALTGIICYTLLHSQFEYQMLVMIISYLLVGFADYALNSELFFGEKLFDRQVKS